MKNQLLLLEDIEGIGHSGDIVSVKPGFARNFLLPQRKAVMAEKHLVRLQERLKAERAERASVDKGAAEELAQQLQGKAIKLFVKIDADRNMYGSVTAQDIAKAFKEQLEVALDKKNIVLVKPIKKLGLYEIDLRLKEGVPAQVTLEILPEELVNG